SGVFLPRQQLRQPVQTEQEGGSRERQAARKGRPAVSDGGREARGVARAREQEARKTVARVSRLVVWHRQTQRPGKGRTRAPEDDPGRAGGTRQLSGAGPALRRSRRV